MSLSVNSNPVQEYRDQVKLENVTGNKRIDTQSFIDAITKIFKENIWDLIKDESNPAVEASHALCKELETTRNLYLVDTKQVSVTDRIILYLRKIFTVRVNKFVYLRDIPGYDEIEKALARNQLKAEFERQLDEVEQALPPQIKRFGELKEENARLGGTQGQRYDLEALLRTPAATLNEEPATEGLMPKQLPQKRAACVKIMEACTEMEKENAQLRG